MLGKRAEEVESMLNKYLDDASLSALTQVPIVHGSGTGVLRQIVRDIVFTSAGEVLVGKRGGRQRGGDNCETGEIAKNITYPPYLERNLYYSTGWD